MDNRFPLECLHFSPTESRKLASVGSGAKQWDVDNGEMTTMDGGRTFAVFSPDGSTIATHGFLHETAGVEHVNLVDAETGELRLRLLVQQLEVFTADFSVDGRKIATGSKDGSCKVWDSSTGELLLTIELDIERDGNWVWSVSWGHDWVRDTQGAVAFAMGLLPRLGEGSRVLGLDPGVVRMILERAA